MSDFDACTHYISQLNEQSISAFIGAGLSKPCGMPDWEELVKPYAQKLGINPKEMPYPRILQYSLHQKADYSFFLATLKSLEDKCHPQVAHRLIARLNLSRIWTTNYDSLLERAYQDECMRYQIVASDDDLYNLNYRSNQIIKMHGSLTQEKTTDIVLLESEYENYHFHRKGIIHLLENDIRNKCILYLGCSFDDPNIRRFVASVWHQKVTGTPSFLFTVPPKQAEKQLFYNCWKNDLTNYNIKIIELSDYTQINSFLYKQLEVRFGKTILLIGKRDDTKFNSLAHRIGFKLAESGYKIHSGGGPNIAQSLAQGAWEYLESKKIPIDDKVVFYYRYHGGSTNPQKGQIHYCGETRNDVRKKMITSDKICILIGDEPNTENGIQEEIGIAYQKGARIIPVGCSGEVSRKYWETEYQNYLHGGVFAEKKQVFELLNCEDASEEQIAGAVVDLADYLLVRNYES